jgi:metal-responsive CopG/Arc/MetJ family transcriptional regulator
MKTAISVPDVLFHEVERRLSELRMSRSEFYATAARAFLDKLESESLTAEIDAAIARIRTDPEAAAAMDREQAEWSEFASRRLYELTADDEW